MCDTMAQDGGAVSLLDKCVARAENAMLAFALGGVAARLTTQMKNYLLVCCPNCLILAPNVTTSVSMSASRGSTLGTPSRAAVDACNHFAAMRWTCSSRSSASMRATAQSRPRAYLTSCEKRAAGGNRAAYVCTCNKAWLPSPLSTIKSFLCLTAPFHLTVAFCFVLA